MKVTATMPVIGKTPLAAMLREVDAEAFKEPPKDSFTVPQYARAIGQDRETARRHIAGLITQGRVARVGTFSVRDGGHYPRRQYLPHYVLVQSKPSKK